MREGCSESRRCSRVTYLESYIIKYTSIQRSGVAAAGGEVGSVSFGLKSLIDMGGVPREQKMLKEHLPRVMYHQVY